MLQDASTAGDLSDTGVAGSFKDKTGWEKVKSKFRWEGGEGDPGFSDGVLPITSSYLICYIRGRVHM